jgi:hypothetical protein
MKLTNNRKFRNYEIFLLLFVLQKVILLQRKWLLELLIDHQLQQKKVLHQVLNQVAMDQNQQVSQIGIQIFRPLVVQK